MHNTPLSNIFSCPFEWLLFLTLVTSGAKASATYPTCGSAGLGSCLSEGEEVEALRVSFLQHAHGVHRAETQGTGHSESSAAQPQATRPNIAIFMPDDMYLADYTPWSSTTSYAPSQPDGFPGAVKPIPDYGLMHNLAKIAQAGATFAKAYSTSSYCTPSRYSVITGRYPSRNWYALQETQAAIGKSGAGSFVYQELSFLDGVDETLNMASALQSSGYSTGFVGKWGLTHKNRGGSFESPYSRHQDVVKAAGFDYADGVYISNVDDCRGKVAICDEVSHNMEWLLESALVFMTGALDRHVPFFLMFYPTIPHAPYTAEALDGLYNSSQTPAGLLSSPPDISKYCSSCYMPPREEIMAAASGLSETAVFTQKVASVYWVDLSLGVLYDFLTEKQVIENTYIVILTDNGPGKGHLYEMGCRIPLYVAGPTIVPGTIISEPVSLVDIAPTVLTWAGVTTAPRVEGLEHDGLSWASLVDNSSSSLDRHGVFLEVFFDRALVSSDGVKYYEVDDRKLPKSLKYSDHDICSSCQVAYPAFGEKYQLYQLNIDPKEQQNLAYDPALAATLRRSQMHVERHKIMSET